MYTSNILQYYCVIRKLYKYILVQLFTIFIKYLQLLIYNTCKHLPKNNLLIKYNA